MTDLNKDEVKRDGLRPYRVAKIKKIIDWALIAGAVAVFIYGVLSR